MAGSTITLTNGRTHGLTHGRTFWLLELSWSWELQLAPQVSQLHCKKQLLLAGEDRFHKPEKCINSIYYCMPYQTSQSRNKCVFMHIDDKITYLLIFLWLQYWSKFTENHLTSKKYAIRDESSQRPLMKWPKTSFFTIFLHNHATPG